MQSIVSSGEVFGVQHAGGLRVQIRASSAAYDTSVVIRALTNSLGGFRAPFRPESNVRFVATFASSQRVSSDSSQQTVVAVPNVQVREARTDQSSAGIPEVLLTVSARAPGGPSGGQRPRLGSAKFVYVYVSTQRLGRYYRVASLPVSGIDASGGTVRYRGQTLVPLSGRLAERGYLTECARGLIFKGVGVGYSRCGRAVITVADYG
jgi:hypothetical protein